MNGAIQTVWWTSPSTWPARNEHEAYLSAEYPLVFPDIQLVVNKTLADIRCEKTPFCVLQEDFFCVGFCGGTH